MACTAWTKSVKNHSLKSRMEMNRKMKEQRTNYFEFNNRRQRKKYVGGELWKISI